MFRVLICFKLLYNVFVVIKLIYLLGSLINKKIFKLEINENDNKIKVITMSINSEFITKFMKTPQFLLIHIVAKQIYTVKKFKNMLY